MKLGHYYGCNHLSGDSIDILVASRRPITRENPKRPPATPVLDPEEILRKARDLLRQTSTAAQNATSGISTNISAIISSAETYNLKNL